MVKDSYTIFLNDEQASGQWAKTLAQRLVAPLILAFRGDIGAGKTTIIRAMLRALGVECAIKSPTFSLVESYRCKHFTLHHFDLYRIHNEEELEYIGFRDFFSAQTVCCIEWPEHAGQLLPNIDLQFKLKINNRGRELEMNALTEIGQELLADLRGT